MGFSSRGWLVGVWFISQLILPSSTLSATPCVYETTESNQLERTTKAEAPLPVDTDRIAWAKEGVAKHNQFRKELGITGAPDILFNPEMCGGAQWVSNKLTRPGEPFVRAAQMDSVLMKCADFICQRQAQIPASASEISNCWLNKSQEVIEVLTAAREMCITYKHNEMGVHYYTVHFFPPPSPPRRAPHCIYENGIPVEDPLLMDGTIDRIEWAKEGVAKHNDFRKKLLKITGVPDIAFNPKMCGGAQWVTNKLARLVEPPFGASQMDTLSMQCSDLNCWLSNTTVTVSASHVSDCWLEGTQEERAILTAAREMCMTYTGNGNGIFYYTAHFYPPPPKPHDPGAVSPPVGGHYATPTPRPPPIARPPPTTPRPPPPTKPPPPLDFVIIT